MFHLMAWLVISVCTSLLRFMMERKVSLNLNVMLVHMGILCPLAALESEDFTVLNNEVFFSTSSMSGDVQCVDFADIIEDMTLEGSHHFVVNIDSTSPEINVEYGAEYLSVYIIDNDSELATSLSACHGRNIILSLSDKS